MKRLGHLLAATLVLLLVLGVAAFAQEHGAAQQPASSDAAHAPQSEHAAADPHAEFKESASVRAIGRLLGVSVTTAYWISVLLNFAIIAGGVFFIMKKAGMAAAMRERTATIRREMEEARKSSEEAQRRLAEVESRLSRLDSEIQSLRSGAEQDAHQEEARIRAAAEDDKKKVVQAAEQEIAAMAAAARRELRGYAAELAVDLAEKRIKVDPEMDKALVGEFAKSFGDTKGKA